MSDGAGRVLAVIPARGGSKRLPRKNAALMLGKPLVSWVIEATLGSRFVRPGDAVVSTDDDEIAAIAGNFGARTIRRPIELSHDHVWTEPVIRHAVEVVEATDKQRVDVVLWMNASIPEVQSSDIDAAITKLLELKLREVIAVGSDNKCTSAVRVLRRECLEQHALSVNVGVHLLDYIDIHHQHDLELVASRMQKRYTREL